MTPNQDQTSDTYSIEHGLGTTCLPDSSIKQFYDPIDKLTYRQRQKRKPIRFCGISFYIYDSQLPGLFNRKTGLSSRGGMADLIHRFEKDHTSEFKIDRTYANALHWTSSCQEQFASGKPADIYEWFSPEHPMSPHFIDLRPWLIQKNPFTGKIWHTDFTGPAKQAMKFSRKNKPVRFLLIDYTAPGFTYNIDILTQLGIKLPILTWHDWETALDTCQKADFSWPVAMYNAWPQRGILPLMQTLTDMLLRRFETRLKDRSGQIDRQCFLNELMSKTSSGPYAAYVEAFYLIKKLSRYFIWYANRYDSIQSKPYYFSKRPQCLFRYADFRRVRADMELYKFIRNGKRLFPFQEGAMSIPEVTTATSEFAGGPPRQTLRPGLWLGITQNAIKRKRVDTAVRFLQFLTTPENQTFFTSFSHTRSAVKKGKVIPELVNKRLTTQPLTLYYDGWTPEAQKCWHDGISSLIEPYGKVADMEKALIKSLQIDLKRIK